jgi:hypothetical protein
VIEIEEPLPTTINKGLDEAKGRRVEILPTDRVVWCVMPKSATQSWTEVGGGWSAMVLKELASDCWSQSAPSQGFHPEAGMACCYSGLLVQRLLLLLLWPGQEAGRHVDARCSHEGLRTLLSSGHGTRVHSHVPL